MNNSKSNFSSSFCPERVAKIKALLESSTSLSIIGVPGAGISIFLKYLAEQPFGYSVYIDVFGLPNLTSSELFRTVLTQLGGNAELHEDGEIVTECKRMLEKLSQRHEKVIIYFGGFDQLKKSFHQEFFHHLRSLRSVDQKKIIFVFGICRRIESLVSKDLMDIDLNMLSSVYYLKPYSDEDLRAMLAVYGPQPTDTIDEYLKLSGGHFQLLQLLLRSERLHDPMNDPFIKLALSNIYQHLTYQQKKLMKKIALQEVSNVDDDYLINVGLIKKVGTSYKMFSPLFEEYLRSQTALKLPVKEARLLKLLKENIGNVVAKESIVSFVWKDEIEDASDWALDALIYRLRRNPAFIAKGYVIENHKKQGYALLKN